MRQARLTYRTLARLQALVFCNGRLEGQALADRLCALGYPSVFVSGSHAQVKLSVLWLGPAHERYAQGMVRHCVTWIYHHT